MIHLLDQSLRRLLVHELNIDDEQVSFHQPVGDWMTGLGSNKPVVNLYLYDIRENAPLRRQQWEQVVNGQQNDAQRQGRVTLRRSPLLMDCFYVVSAWSQADQRTRPTQEHSMLSRCLLALARHPVLNPKLGERGELLTTPGRSILAENRQRQLDFLEAPLADQEVEIRTRVANHDVLTNPAEVWSALENQIKAAFSYVVTLPMDPWQDLTQTAGEVGSATFISAGPLARTDAESLPRVKPAEKTHTSPSLVGGIVQTVTIKTVRKPDGSVHAAEERNPYPGLDVWVIEKGLRVVTDKQGRFIFRRLPPGEYTIAVYRAQTPKASQEEDVILPAQRTDEPLWRGHYTVPSNPQGETRTIVVELAPDSSDNGHH